MVVTAVATYARSPEPRVIVAAIMFFVSDLAVARQKFVVPSITNRYWGLPLYFGAIAVALAANSLNNSRRVQHLGVHRLIRQIAIMGVVTSAALAIISYTNGGRPNFWAFTIALTLTVPMAQGLSPLCNTAAMTPLPHVAGTASAIIATVTTAGGALLGTLANSAFDGTTRPFGLHMVAYLCGAELFITLGTVRHRASSAI